MKHILTILLVFLSISLSFSQNRSQEPKAPFNYTSEDITFVNSKAENITLAGTLTLPKNVKKPAVAILISGSGPQNRNSELLGHKSFLVLSDYLTNNGIAVLRYDERGIGASEGDFKKASTFDLTLDVEAAVTYLKTRKDINTKKIGLIGHSEGGLIAPIVASRNKSIAFIVLLGGPGVNGQKVLETQSWKIAELSGASPEVLEFNKKITSIGYNVINTENDTEKQKLGIENGLKAYKASLEKEGSSFAQYISDPLITQLTMQLTNHWLQTFVKIDPKPYLENTKCPVLAINGSKDIQVLPEVNLPAIKKHLETANNKDVTIKELDGLNHLFQKAETGLLNEYATIEETFSPTALVIIKDWILKRF